MPFIVETIVTTKSPAGAVHIAPLGLIARGNRWIVAPFRPSRTLDNLEANGFLVANHTDDVRVFAGCVTGRRDWPLMSVDTGDGAGLASAIAHWELTVEATEDDSQRPRFVCRTVREVIHAPWRGFNRAQAAVIEAAVLVTRLHMLPAEKIEAELKYLTIAVEKTAGPREVEAWSWLQERFEAWRRGEPSANVKA
jgi:hypothetical protein